MPVEPCFSSLVPLQGRNVVLESKYGSPKIVNDGVTVAKEVELEDPVENIGAKLVRQVCAFGCLNHYYIIGERHATGLCGPAMSLCKLLSTHRLTQTHD